MRSIYIDCSMGAAGDMLTAALLELLPDPAGFVEKLNALGIPGVTFRAEPSTKCGIQGTHMRVTVHGHEEHEHHHQHDETSPHPAPAGPPSPQGEGFGSEYHHTHEHEEPHHHEHHHHTGLHGIEHLVRDHLALPEPVRDDVLAVYRLLAEAESRVHGMPVEEIHFHEVGSLDAVADVAAVCLLMRELAPQRVLASPIHVGAGQVRCAHGLMPVPAPATAELLKGVPINGGAIQGELCTPTGAALLKYYVNSFGPMPVMRTRAVGYGMGKKDFPAANCVRAFLGETEDSAAGGHPRNAPAGEEESAAGGCAFTGDPDVLELICNLDDMTAEDIAFAMDQALDAGALEVWTQPIGMKKSRPGTMLCVLCKPSDRDALVSLLFRHTTTLGVREASRRRTVLNRWIETVRTRFGPVRRKVAEGCGVRREKYEYEDLAQIARAQDLPLETVREVVNGEDGG